MPSLKEAGRRLGWVGLAGTVLAGGGAAAVSTPDTSNIPAAYASGNGYHIGPGWIERDSKAPFIQLDKGHFYWLKEKINNNPMLLALTRDFFKYLLECAQKGERLKLGDAFAYNILRARDRIQAHDSSHIDPNTNLHLEIIRTASFPLAAGFAGQWWEAEDLEKFGISLDEHGYKDIDDFHWGPRGIGTVAYPKLFGIDREEPKESSTAKIKNGGQDRAIHVAHHALVVFERLYSQYYGLSTHESMPNILKLHLGWVANGYPYQEAIALSEITGRGYEVSGLKDIRNWPINGRTAEIIPEGIFDSMVDADLKGNRLGAEIAIALFERVRKRQSVDDIIAQLNDPRYADFATPPTLNLPR